VKAPLSWLQEYVVVDRPVAELAERLALTGTEVERVTQTGLPADSEGIDRFVVGKVLTCERHPDADKLSVCTVDVGEAEARTIVCGAPNVAAGQTVGVCLPGAVLPGGMRIKEAKLRGVPSSGMILSAAELGFEAKSAGIMMLPQEWAAGEQLRRRLPLSDWVLEVEVTPNRPDCLSIEGLARELAAVTGATVTLPRAGGYTEGERDIADDIAIEVLDPDLCPRYAARVMRGVTIGESPPWLKARLTNAGMRPVNNVVDVTNYVMWAVGQPLHAFDLERVRGRRIIVRRARTGETMMSLDGTLRALTTDMLVIGDAEGASAIGGIMGSTDSEVASDTTNILLEAANFHGASIMRTSSALGLRSEASTRFEKGLDPNLVISALDMACRMFVELCGGTVSRGIVDVSAGAVRPWQLRLRPARVEAILGVAVPVGEMKEILERLGCQVAGEGITATGRELLVTVPTFRRDLEREIDLIEEVARIFGLDRLPATIPARRVGRGGLNGDQRRLRTIVDVLQGAGVNEALTFSFVDPSWMDRLQLAPDDTRRTMAALTNPLSGDQSVMRTLLLPGLLATAGRNVSVREERVHLFEVGKVFRPGRAVQAPADGTPAERAAALLPHEPQTLGLLLYGEWLDESWLARDVPTDFSLAKGLVERVLGALGVEATYVPVVEPFLHPGKSAGVVVGDRHIGWLGEVHPLVARAFDLTKPTISAELDLDAVLAAVGGVPLFEDLLSFPAVEQDLALVVERTVLAADVVAAVRAAGGSLLRSVRVFDVYEGPQVGEGKKSLALRLVFRSEERTLSEAEINDERQGMLTALAESLGATLRS
jgi:phenylalanyl-tRNA synthetase beta chain